MVKLGSEGVYLIFLFLIQNIHCGYSLEPHRRDIPTMYVLNKNIKKIDVFPMKFSIFTTIKIPLLHGKICVTYM